MAARYGAPIRTNDKQECPFPPWSHGAMGRVAAKTGKDFSENSTWQSGKGVCSHSFPFETDCQPTGLIVAVAGQTLDQLNPMARRERRKLPRLADTYSGRNGKAVQSGERAKERLG